MWAILDSGDGDRSTLFAFKLNNGSVVDIVAGVEVRAFPVPVVNTTGKDIAIDDSGHLWLGDRRLGTSVARGYRKQRLPWDQPSRA
jgi:hypothetical protein